VRKTRHDGVSVSLSLINQPQAKSGNLSPDALDGSPKIKLDVSRNLVVSGSACMQTLTRITNQLSEARFDIHMYVFELNLPIEDARGYLFLYLG
jgi:hypothetical protein